MTIAVSVKVHDGVVLAADSCVLHKGQTYLNAEKIIAPVKGAPFGVIISGDGAIGPTSVANHLREFGRQSSSRSSPFWFDRSTLTIHGLARTLGDYLSDLSVRDTASSLTSLTLCGYSAGAVQPETWRLLIDGRAKVEPEPLWLQNAYGITWDGERECLDRLLCGTSSQLRSVAQAFGLGGRAATDFVQHVSEACESELVAPGMPLADAVKLARFLVETTISFVGFCLDRQPKIVGGPIDVATITRHDGFRWLRRKKRNAAARA